MILEVRLGQLGAPPKKIIRHGGEKASMPSVGFVQMGVIRVPTNVMLEQAQESDFQKRDA